LYKCKYGFIQRQLKTLKSQQPLPTIQSEQKHFTNVHAEQTDSISQDRHNQVNLPLFVEACGSDVSGVIRPISEGNFFGLRYFIGMQNGLIVKSGDCRAFRT